jgi:hypothetical protein
MSELSDQSPNHYTNGLPPEPDPTAAARDAEPPAGAYDNSGRRIAVKPPEWDPLPPDESIQRYQG